MAAPERDKNSDVVACSKVWSVTSFVCHSHKGGKPPFLPGCRPDITHRNTKSLSRAMIFQLCLQVARECTVRNQR